MKLEHQVCTLEQAKKLKELGVDVAGDFYWAYCWPNNRPSQKAWRVLCEPELESWNHDQLYSAYSAAELGVMLPVQTTWGRYCLYKKENIWVSGYLSKGDYPYTWPSINDCFAKTSLLSSSIVSGFIEPKLSNNKYNLSLPFSYKLESFK